MKDTPPTAALHQGQPALIRYVATGSANGALVASTGALLLLSMGATPFHIGILATVSQLEQIGALGGAELMRHLGKTRLMMWGRLLSAPITAGLAIAAALGMSGERAIWITIAVFGLRGLIQQVATVPWWPLIQDVTAGGHLGAFVARMRIWQRFLLLTFPLAVGAWLGQEPDATRFALPYAVAVVVLLLAAWWIRSVPERPLGPSGEPLWHRVRLVFGEPTMRRFCGFLALTALLRNAALPFWVVVLTQRGMPVSEIVWMGSLLALGELLTLKPWGKLLDRVGWKPTLRVPMVFYALLGTLWLVVPAGPGLLLLWAAILHLARGALDAGMQMGESRVMVDAVPRSLQGEGFAIVLYASSVTGALGGFLGGLAFERLESVGLSGELYLGGLQAALLLPLALTWYLRKD